MPFSANHDAIKRHFLSLNPTSIRHPTNKITGRSKGYAFLEFAGYDRLKTCLKIYHHSVFDDGESPPRKINVELTYFLFNLPGVSPTLNIFHRAGGGGSSSVRKSKLRAKNEKLNQERIKRTEGEKGAQNVEIPDIAEAYMIHPSRRSMIVNLK